jgi:cell division protein FtsW (lipid II flippase)
MSNLPNIFPDSTQAQQVLEEAIARRPDFFEYYTAFSRVALGLLAIFIVVRCAISLLGGRGESERWGFITLKAGGIKLPVAHWENTIGRSRYNDILINFPTVSRSHAALIRDGARWKLTDLGSKGGTSVNGKVIAAPEFVNFGDTIEFGGTPTTFEPLSDEEKDTVMNRATPGTVIRPAFTIYLLTVFQLVMAMQLSIAAAGNFRWEVPFCFAFLIVLTWAYFIFFRVQNRRGFEVDTIAFFLATLGMSVTASSEPEGILTHSVALLAGVGLFLVLGWFCRDLKRAISMRWPMAAAAIGLLGITLLLGSVVYGAKNWIYIGGFSIQPSELAKVCFVYAGAAPLDRLFAKRNIWMYIGLTAICAGALAIMSDFGAVTLFFVAFLVVAYLRSGDLKTIIFAVASAVFGGVIVLRFRPYILARFNTWRHAWEYAHSGGYQQTRTMSAAASGGLFGMGAGEGWLKRIPAADTDLVFGMVAEEMGLIVAVSAVACICTLAVFAARSAANSRSAFYTIAACSATAMLVFQMTLNVLGSVDILPLTGVTFPFVSNGGSSLISSFGLLAFIKAVDTRQNASFAAMPQKTVFKKGEKHR